MSDTPLVLPYDIEGAIIQVIDERHAEHLAKLERLRGLNPRTFEPFATVVRMADATGLRLSGDTTPALLLAIIGAPTFEEDEDQNINAVYQLGMQVTVMGQKRRDTIYKRDAMAWTVAECLYQRLPRRGLIHAIRLVDYEPLAEANTQRTLGDARMVWEVSAKNVLSITGYLPASDSTLPPEDGGAPADPYGPPVAPPDAIPTVTLDRTPIVE